MRAQLLVASVLASGVILLGVACDTEEIYVQADGGTASSSSSSSSSSSGQGSTSSSSSGGPVGDDDDDVFDAGLKKDAGPPFDLPSTKIVDRDDIALVGIVGDDVIYQVARAGSRRELFAVPIGGGTPAKLFTFVPGEGLAISGGALAHWTAPANGAGTLDVWTRATGLRTAVATSSVLNLYFRATADGSRIAFSQNATIAANKPVAAEIGVRNTADATNLVTFSGANNTMNLETLECPPRFAFATGSKAFFGAFCTGTGTAETRSRLLAVPDATPAAILRLDADDEGAANTIRGTSGFSVDSTGTKVAAVELAGLTATLFNVASPVTRTTIDTGVNDVTFLPNGSAIIYRVLSEGSDAGGPPPTITTLKKATVATPPVISTLGTGVVILGPISPDSTRLVYGSIRDAATSQFDMHILALNAPAAPVDLVAGAKGTVIGYNAASTHFVWADATTSPAKVRSIPLAGGPIRDIAPGAAGRLAGSGSGMVIAYNPVKQGNATFFTIGHVDAVAGGAVKSISDAMPDGELFIRDKTVAYLRAKQGDYAMYGLTLP